MNKNLKIAVLSGKGGTGKTFIAVNLAAILKEGVYLDCDVEAPDGSIFLKPQNVTQQPVYKIIPTFNKDKCTECRQCIQFCNFNALCFIKGAPKVFNEVCHYCGGCELICSQHAVSHDKHRVGQIEVGYHNDNKNIKVVTGLLDIGEASGVGIIKQVLSCCDDDKPNIIDCPPGSSCSCMESIMDAEYCLIVTEPTIFGLHNFKMVYELCTLLNKKVGVIINKCNNENNPIDGFCNENNIKVIARIPFSKETAVMLSTGEVAVYNNTKLSLMFEDIAETIKKEVM